MSVNRRHVRVPGRTVWRNHEFRPAGSRHFSAREKMTRSGGPDASGCRLRAAFEVRSRQEPEKSSIRK